MRTHHRKAQFWRHPLRPAAVPTVFGPTDLRGRRRAFTLIEIVLSLGILSFAIIPLIGMLAIGSNSFQSSIAQTIQTQITQSLFSEVQQKPFANLGSVLGTVRYFDADGAEVDKSAMVYSSVMREADKSSVLDSNSSMGLAVAVRTNPAADAPTRVIQIVICSNADLEASKTKTLAELSALFPARISAISVIISDMGL